MHHVLNSCRSRRKKRKFTAELNTGNPLCSTPAGVAEKNAYNPDPRYNNFGVCSTPAGVAEKNAHEISPYLGGPMPVLNSCRSRRKKRIRRWRFLENQWCAQLLPESQKKTLGQSTAGPAWKVCSTPAGVAEKNAHRLSTY